MVRCPFSLIIASNLSCIDVIVQSIIPTGKLNKVFLNLWQKASSDSYWVFCSNDCLQSLWPTRWKKFSIGFKLGDRGRILKMRQGIELKASWDSLLLWERSPFWMNSFQRLLFSLWNNSAKCSLTNLENISPFTWLSYWWHPMTPFP